MFTRKLSKGRSSAKLLKILVDRSDKDLYSTQKSDWPATFKPSLLNKSRKILQYGLNDEPKPIKKQGIYKQNGLKQAATFSTCSTMSFVPPNIYPNKNQSLSRQNSESISYVSPIESSHEKSIIQRVSEFELNCKYFESQKQNIKRPKTTCSKVNSDKMIYQSFNKNKREIQTAKLSQQTFQKVSNLNEQEQLYIRKQLKKSTFSGVNSQLKNKGMTPTKDTSQVSSSPSFSISGVRNNINGSPSNFEQMIEYPKRLKDYEANFHSYKLMSRLIDEKIKWNPRQKRPKSSLLMRKCYV